MIALTGDEPALIGGGDEQPLSGDSAPDRGLGGKMSLYKMGRLNVVNGSLVSLRGVLGDIAGIERALSSGRGLRF